MQGKLQACRVSLTDLRFKSRHGNQVKVPAARVGRPVRGADRLQFITQAMKANFHRDDVARLAGVSSATVSYVINNGPRPVSAETRARVLDAIQRLGYRPNAVARNLRRQRTSTLGLILPDAQNPFFAQVAEGIQRVALEHGYILIQCHSDFSEERELQFVETLYVERTAGVLWFPTSGNAEPARQLAKYQVPLVLIDRLTPGLAAPYVVTDNFRGGFLATQHLIECGHTRIGCIARPSDLSHSQQRIRGYLKALEDHALAIDESLIVRSGYRPEAGRLAALELIQHSPRPTAIFAYNDFMAIGALRAAYEQGLRVPEDLAVVGFDDIPQAAMACPSLTSVSPPKSELGERAAQMLIELIDGKTPDRTEIVLDVELIVRESTRATRRPGRALSLASPRNEDDS